MPKKFTQFTKKEISTLFDTARKVFAMPGVVIRCAPRALDSARLLLVIPRKVGNAPVRNKLRRQLKAIFYEESFLQKEFDFIVIVNKQAIDYSFDQLKSFLLKAYEQATTAAS